MKKTILTISLAISLIASVSTNANASLASNATLLMGPQTGICEFDLGVYPDACLAGVIPTGNYIEISNNPNPNAGVDRIPISAGTDGGIKLGSTQTNGEIDALWIAFGAPGWHSQTGTISISSDDGVGNVTLNMSGLEMIWNNQPNALTQGADATITCGFDCSNNDTYTLDYSSVMTGVGIFGYTGYRLHMTGTISSVPIPAAIWLFGSGLIGLIGMARRKTHV